MDELNRWIDLLSTEINAGVWLLNNGYIKDPEDATYIKDVFYNWKFSANYEGISMLRSYYRNIRNIVNANRLNKY